MKDIKQIEWDFHYATWVRPRGRTWGRQDVGGQKFIFFKHGRVAFQIDGDGDGE